MQRRAILALVLAAGCTRATAPKARFAGEVLSITGVVGLMAGALTSRYTSSTDEIMASFSIMSAVGIGAYAAGELTDPAREGAPRETPEQTHRRWAKILTERAGGAAREGNCRRVVRLEKRVNVYNREVHDFVFMRDPEIVKCLETETGPTETDTPTLPRGLDMPVPAPETPLSDR